MLLPPAPGCLCSEDTPTIHSQQNLCLHPRPVSYMAKMKVLRTLTEEPCCVDVKVVINQGSLRCPSPKSHSTESKTKTWVVSGLSEIWVQVGAKLILELRSPVCTSGCRCHSHKRGVYRYFDVTLGYFLRPLPCFGLTLTPIPTLAFFFLIAAGTDIRASIIL